MKPIIKFTVDGSEVGELFQKRFLSASVTDQAGQESDSITITLDDEGGRLAMPRKGVEIKVQVGYSEQKINTLGRFIVDDISVSGAPDRMVIRGKAANLRKALPHIDQTESDINLLTRLARERDAIAKPVGAYLLFVPKGQSRTVTGQDLPKITHTLSSQGYQCSVVCEAS